MQATDTRDPDYFHKVVDCQWACPAHTPVPEYIRLIGQGKYTDAYMVNWTSNVFPGILGRTCDRPCEPACRRSRVEENNGEKNVFFSYAGKGIPIYNFSNITLTPRVLLQKSSNVSIFLIIILDNGNLSEIFSSLRKIGVSNTKNAGILLGSNTLLKS